MPPVIQARGFGFQYPTAETPALEDLSFTLEAGDVLGVLGPVEAGKTTLSMALSGFVPELTGGRTEGDLSVAGRDPREADDDRVAMVFEDYASQLTQLRVVDEVLAPLTNTGTARHRAHEEARDLVDAVGLGDVAEDKPTWELSGGQQQRLAIAAALAIDPDVLVFDTATDMLDPQGRRDVLDLLRGLAGRTTLVVAESHPERLVGLADRLLALDDGEPLVLGDADELLRTPGLYDRLGLEPPAPLEVGRRIGLPGTPASVREFEAAYPHQGVDTDTSPRPDDDRATRRGDSSPSGDLAPDPVLEVDGTSFSYPDGTRAVDDVDLGVRRGEVHAVVGGNGAGKSTLSHLAAGLMSPDSGAVRVDGTDLAEVPAEHLGETVGIAFQNPDEQISRPTVEDEIRYALEARQHERRGPLGILGKRERYGDDRIARRTEAARSLVGLSESLRDEDPIFLPRGRRRLVTIAAAVAPDPAALVLDEPAAGLDARALRRVQRAVAKLTEDGKGVLLVEHDMDFVCNVADRVTVLADGRVAEQGPPREVFDPGNWDALAELEIRPPTAARLAEAVGTAALTVDELAAQLPTPKAVSP